MHFESYLPNKTIEECERIFGSMECYDALTQHELETMEKLCKRYRDTESKYISVREVREEIFKSNRKELFEKWITLCEVCNEEVLKNDKQGLVKMYLTSVASNIFRDKCTRTFARLLYDNTRMRVNKENYVWTANELQTVFETDCAVQKVPIVHRRLLEESEIGDIIYYA